MDFCDGRVALERGYPSGTESRAIQSLLFRRKRMIFLLTAGGFGHSEDYSAMVTGRYHKLSVAVSCKP